MECPICKSEARELERGLFDGHALRCPVHGEIEFSDTVRATRLGEPRDAWECAVKNTQHETVAGKRPRILDSDF